MEHPETMATQPELSLNEKAERFDRSMLKVLMVEFIRDTNIPYLLIENVKFRTMLQFMRPDLPLPTVQDLMQLNTTETDTFLFWDRSLKYVAGLPEDVRNHATEAVNNDRIRLVKQDAGIFDEPLSAPLVETGIPNLYGDDPLARELSVEPEEREIESEEKPNSLEMGTSSSASKRTREDDEGPSCSKSLKVPKTETAANIPINPCIFCLEPLDNVESQEVHENDAMIMIYMSVMDGFYTMDSAKQIAQFASYRVCVPHFAELGENALHHFGVVDTRIDIHTGNSRIASACSTIEELRCAKYGIEYKGNKKQADGEKFCSHLRDFFTQYNS